MSENLNPYAAPQSDLAAVREAIPFAGEVTRDDLPALLPPALLRPLLLGLALLFILPFALLPIAFVFLGIGPPSELGGIILFVLMLLTAAGTAFWLSSPQRRADQLIFQNPNFIGPIRGTLSSLGFERADPQKLTSISWSEIRSVYVGKAGIRIDLRREVQTFIAIPAHCFSDYDSLQMRAAVAALRSVDAGQVESASAAQGLPVLWRLTPENAICFDGVVHEDAQRTARRRICLRILLAVVTGLGFLLLGLAVVREWYSLVPVLLAAWISGYVIFEKQSHAWWNSTEQPNSRRQYGWISERLIYSVLSGREHYDSWQVVDEVRHDSECVKITWRDQTWLRVPRRHLVDPEQWETLRALVDAENADRQP